MNKEIDMTQSIAATAPVSPLPRAWWRFRIVWFAFGLPALVVVASLYTVSLAWRHADPQVFDPLPGRSVGAEEVVEKGHIAAGAMEPAEHARNHAAMPAR